MVKQRHPLSLEERTDKHLSLRGRDFTAVPLEDVQRLLSHEAKFIGQGGFCRVWLCPRFDLKTVGGRPSPAFGKPVAIKVVSAGFKDGLSEVGLAAKQHSLSRHAMREKNAHLVLEGQPRVVQVHHTFCGADLVVPATHTDRARVLDFAEGMIEEYCSETSLSSFSFNIAASVRRRLIMLPLRHLASEFAALARQVHAFQELGIAHQDIKPCNVLVHNPSNDSGLVTLKFGDLNGAQWEALTINGAFWLATPGTREGYMPRKVAALYQGRQAYPSPGVGEHNLDTFQTGKTLLRLLLDYTGSPFIPFPKKEDDLAAEDSAVKHAAVEMLDRPSCLPDEPPRELYAFGVLAALLACWDGEYDYKHKEQQLRLAPADLAEVLESWGGIAAAWEEAQSMGKPFWGADRLTADMARLYLRLAELARAPPLDQPAEPEVHVQEDELILDVVESFFELGDEERWAPVRAEVQRLLEDSGRAVMALHTAQGGTQRKAPVSLEQQHVAAAGEHELALLACGGPPAKAGTRPAGPVRRWQENDHRPLQAGGGKRKAGGAAGGTSSGAAAAPKQARRAKPPQTDDLLILNAKLRVKDVWGLNGKPAKMSWGVDVPGLLAGAVRTLAGPAGTSVVLQLTKKIRLQFSLAERGGRRSVRVSRAALEAVAAESRARNTWNTLLARLKEGQSLEGQAEVLRGLAAVA